MLGGVVAGSAAAWALSTAGAQAAPVQAPEFDGAKELKQAAKELAELPEKAVGAVRDTVHEVGKALTPKSESAKPGKPQRPAPRPQAPQHHEQPREVTSPAAQPAGPLDDIGSLLAGVLSGGSQSELPKPPAAETPDAPGCAPEFAEWCERIADWFTPPQPDDLVPNLPSDDEHTVPSVPGGAELPSILPAPAHDAVTAQPAVDGGAPVERAAVAATADEQVDGGLGSRGHPAHHDFPGKHTPLGAPGQPVATAPASGAALGGHADGSPMAITAAATAAAVGSVTTALRRNTPGIGRVGGQPGVTPD